MFLKSLPPFRETCFNGHFDRLKTAFVREDVRLAREMMRTQMLDNGVDYDDFLIAYSFSTRNNEWLATFRTIREPLPPNIYSIVVSAFNEAFASSYRSRLNTTTEVRLVCETDEYGVINLHAAEEMEFLAAGYAALLDHIDFLKTEIDGWQRGFDSDVYALLWPGLSKHSGNTCILITLHVHGGHYRDDDPEFNGIRNFIRSLPEYRHSRCIDLLHANEPVLDRP